MINLKNYKNRDEVLQLLAACMSPNEEKVRAALAAYENEHDRELLGEVRDNELVGLIGLVQHPGYLELKHIAVKNDYRSAGIGGKMILAYMSKNDITELTAETDIDAVNFYRKTGFLIQSLGEKYPGRERFKCTLTVDKTR